MMHASIYSVNIKYYESKMNLNWKPVLKTILDNPEKFIEDGGWNFLNLEGSDSEDGDSDESEGFKPSDEEGSGSGSDDSDDSDESMEDVRPPPPFTVRAPA